MINIGGNPLMILLAIVAALGGVGLYFVRNFRPELARDHDVFFSAIALVYGIILLAFNFRMEITTQLAQVLVVGFAGWFAVESLILRQALAEQARRSPPMNPFDPEPDQPSAPPEARSSYGYRVELDPRRELTDYSETSRRMRSATGVNPNEGISELGGDVKNRRNSRRRSNGNSAETDSDNIIDINPAPDQNFSESSRRRRKPNLDANLDANSNSDLDQDSSDRRSRSRNRPTGNLSDPRPSFGSKNLDDLGDFSDF
ncbi:MAG: Ycf66 family protein [Pseudanabaenaceae cyanobacterium bins.68]|nr:Ycf66 family protein [Pseudanabaenaceae cyanobacterium bins.68]